MLLKRSRRTQSLKIFGENEVSISSPMLRGAFAGLAYAHVFVAIRFWDALRAHHPLALTSLVVFPAIGMAFMRFPITRYRLLLGVGPGLFFVFGTQSLIECRYLTHEALIAGKGNVQPLFFWLTWPVFLLLQLVSVSLAVDEVREHGVPKWLPAYGAYVFCAVICIVQFWHARA